MYLVGKIVGLHGIKGELKVRSDSSFERFKEGSMIYIKQEEEYLPFKISSHRHHKDNDLITINNLLDINLVSSYVGSSIYTKHDKKDLKNDEYFYEDLIGKLIISTKQEEIGFVKDIREVPQGILLEVLYKDKIVLIPFVKAFIKSIDEEKIEVEIIEGLL